MKSKTELHVRAVRKKQTTNRTWKKSSASLSFSTNWSSKSVDESERRRAIPTRCELLRHSFPRMMMKKATVRDCVLLRQGPTAPSENFVCNDAVLWHRRTEQLRERFGSNTPIHDLHGLVANPARWSFRVSGQSGNKCIGQRRRHKIRQDYITLGTCAPKWPWIQDLVAQKSYT